jgi:hypothetical protein
MRAEVNDAARTTIKTLCSPDVLYVDNLAVFPAKFRAGRL